MRTVILTLLSVIAGCNSMYAQVQARMAWSANSVSDITVDVQELPSGNLLFFAYNDTGIHVLKTDADLHLLDHRFNPLTGFYISDIDPTLYKNNQIYLLLLPLSSPPPLIQMDLLQFDTSGVLQHRLTLANVATVGLPTLFDLSIDQIGILSQDEQRGGVSVIKVPADLGSVSAGNLDAWNYTVPMSVGAVAAGRADSEGAVLGVTRYSEGLDSTWVTLQQLDTNMDVTAGREWATSFEASGIPIQVLALPGNRMMAAHRSAGFQYQAGVSSTGSAFSLLPDASMALSLKENNGRFLLNYRLPFQGPSQSKGIALWEETDTQTRLYVYGNKYIYRSHFGAGQLVGTSSSLTDMEAETFFWDDVEMCHTPAGTGLMEPLPYADQPAIWSKQHFWASVQLQTVPPSVFQAYPSVTYLCSAAHLAAEEHPAPGINLYPNPAVSFVHIESETPVTGVEVVDVTGKCVYRETVIDHLISVETLPSGLYFFRLYIPGGSVLKKVLLTKE